MIIGEVCTRAWPSVTSLPAQPPDALDAFEPAGWLMPCKNSRLNHVRDYPPLTNDIEDGGAEHFAQNHPRYPPPAPPPPTIEILTPEFHSLWAGKR